MNSIQLVHPLHRLIFTCSAENARGKILLDGGQLFNQVSQFPQLHRNHFALFPPDF